MSASENPRRLPRLAQLRRAPVVITLLIAAAVPLFLTAGWSGQHDDLLEKALWHEVSRTDLAISVIERGNLESQHNEQVYCEVDDVQRDSINGTPIMWIIPNGSSVKKGQLLVELDSSPMREALDEQVLETEEARARYVQAEADYENQLTQNETSEADAQLKIDLAELELEMFQDKQNGTHLLAMEEIKRTIDDVNNEILAAQASLELKDDDRRGVQSLFKLGYANRNELRRSELDYLQAEGQYAAKLNKLETANASLRKKQDYEFKMQMMTLRGQLETAIRNAEQVERNNEARVAQMKQLLASRTEQLKKEEEREARYSMQLKACKIFAPQDGMIAYASDRNDEIREGVPVRYRQHLLSIPSLSQMQVRTAVHESVLDQMEPGLRATIRVDAFPDRSYTGTVQSIAVLPQQNGWRGSDTKVYETVVTIDSEVANLKPGMTAVSEIHVDRLDDVVAVPVQAVLQRDGDTWCMTRQNSRVVPQRVSVGRTNDVLVEVTAGLQPGMQVALNPTDLADQVFTDYEAGGSASPADPAAPEPSDLHDPLVKDDTELQPSGDPV